MPLQVALQVSGIYGSEYDSLIAVKPSKLVGLQNVALNTTIQILDTAGYGWKLTSLDWKYKRWVLSLRRAGPSLKVLNSSLSVKVCPELDCVPCQLCAEIK